MMIRRRRPNRIEGALLGLSGLAIASQTAPDLAIVNESASLPRGLYVRALGAATKSGSVVAVSPPPAALPYLRSLGAPEDARLLKQVAAHAGQHVCVTASKVATPGRRSAPPRARDRRGRALPVWRGCRVLEPGEVFLLGQSAASFDSRYFGPVATNRVQGIYRQVLGW